MIEGETSKTGYDFKRCKLCGQLSAGPAYHLGDCIVYCCHNCDFHYLDQLDTISALSRTNSRLTDQSRRYIEVRSAESARLHPARLELLRRINPSLNSRLLDIGAGLGQFQLLLDKLGFETHGIEPSELRRQYAREKFSLQLSEKLVDNRYWQENYREYFDVITLWDVIEHVNFPRETMENAARLLKPGGLMFLDTPSREALPYRLSQTGYRLSRGKISLFLPGFYSTAPYGHKQIFTRAQLAGLFQQLALNIVYKAQSYGSKPDRGDKIILAARKKT